MILGPRIGSHLMALVKYYLLILLTLHAMIPFDETTMPLDIKLPDQQSYNGATYFTVISTYIFAQRVVSTLRHPDLFTVIKKIKKKSFKKNLYYRT